VGFCTHANLRFSVETKSSEGLRQKIMTTRAVKMEAKKVNNMPNLQSMSQAKGYGRLHKKSSQNSSVFRRNHP
jgi:hypothetical protein